MEDYKPNSHRFKEEQKQLPAETKRVEKVTTGKVMTKKKSEASKIASRLISTEDVSNIKSYLIDDVIIPTIKNTIWDAFTNTLDMVLFGGTGRSRKKTTAEKISYRNYYDRRDDRRYSDAPRSRSNTLFDDILFESRGEAERVLDRMEEVIDSYKMVSVSDMYDLAGLDAPYTGQKYGWTNLRNAEIVRVRDGYYMIKLPKALPFD